MLSFFKDFVKLIRDPDVRRLLPSVAGTLLIGTTFYRFVEGWGWGNSFYFSVITLTTVGYGDFAPVTGIGRLFTTVYLFMGIGFLLAFIDVIAKRRMQMMNEKTN